MVETREAMKLRERSAMAQYFTTSSWGFSWHTLVNWVEELLHRLMQEGKDELLDDIAQNEDSGYSLVCCSPTHHARKTLPSLSLVQKSAVMNTMVAMTVLMRLVDKPVVRRR